MKKTLGILVCGRVRDEIVGKHGEYNTFFHKLLGVDAFHYVDYFVVENNFPANVHDCDGYVLSGSQHGVYEDHAFIPPLERFVREAYAAEIPLVGICFGHQLMAQALGGRVEKFTGGWGLGIQNYSLDLGNGAGSYSLNAVHQDQVIEPPAGAQVLGSSPFCQNAMLAYGRCGVSLQPHPEFDFSFMEDLIAIRRGITFPEALCDDALKTLRGETDNSTIAAFLRQFLTSAMQRKIPA